MFARFAFDPPDASASSDDSSPKSSSEPQMQPSPSRRALPLEPLGSHNLTTPATSDPASASSGSGTVRPAKGRRSQASLRSIPETFQQPPAPLPRLPKTNLTGLATAGGPAQAREPRTTSSTGSRRPSEEVGSGSAEDARDSHAGSSSRHSVGSQYASSSSAWTPSSLWGSRTGREGSLRAGSAARNSMASRDSHYTADTDYDEYFSPKSTAAQLQTRSPPPPRLPSLPPARPLDSDPLSLPSASARRRSHVESVPAVLPPKPEWHHSEAEPGPSAIGLGITADEAIGAGKSARSASVSSVPLRRPSTATTIEPGPGPSTVATRFSRVATLEETPSAQVTAPPSVHGHSNDEEIERSRADDFAARLAEAGQALGKWGADDGLRSKQRRRSSSDESSVLGKAVRTAEAGQGRIVDWSKMHCALEEVEVFPGASLCRQDVLVHELTRRGKADTTHLLLPESRSPFVVNRLLQDCLPNIAARLLVLDISSASLTSIPLEIAACSALEELDVSGNSMRDCVLPRHLAQLRSLRVLAANDCDLFDLPHSLAPLTNLRDLSLRDNHLTALPLWLCHLTNLEVLLVDNNKFVAPWDGLVQPLLRHPNPDRPTPSADPSPPMSASSDGSGVDPSFAAAVRMAQQQSRTGDAKSNRLQIDLAVPPNSKYGLGDVPAPGAASAEAMRRMRSTPDFKGPSRSRTVSGMTHRSAVSKSVFSELSEATVLPTPMERAETMARVGKGLPPAPASEPKKPKGFFKKMSFGKLMKESRSRAPSVVEEVPVIPEPDVASSEAVRRPRLESMSTMNTSVRPLTTASSMLDDESLTSSGLRRSMARRRSFLCLDADWLMTAPIDLDTISSQPSTACATPSVESPVSASTASAIVDARAALRSIIMYTRDVNDLCLNIDASRRPSQKGASRAPGARRMSDAFANGGVVPSPAHTPGPFENGSSGYVNETGPRKIVDDPLRRRRVLEEIAATEQSYIRGLQELQEIYIQPAAAVLSGLGKDKDSVVPVAERRRVFSNVEAIIDFHVGVLFPNIQQAMDPLSTPVEVDEDAGSVSIRDGHRLIRAAEEVSRVFIRHAAFLKLYSTYITQFDGALDRLQEWTQPGPNASSGSASPSISSAMSSPSPKGTALTPAQKKKLASYLKHARRHANHGQINLESYLLLPVQRLPRYKLLLENLVSCTPGTFPGEENHLVAEALKIIATITATLNEQKRSSEGRQRLVRRLG